jgi:hypothetical protein
MHFTNFNDVDAGVQSQKPIDANETNKRCIKGRKRETNHAWCEHPTTNHTLWGTETNKKCIKRRKRETNHAWC